MFVFKKKYFLPIIFFCILLLTACGSVYEKKPEVYTKELSVLVDEEFCYTVFIKNFPAIKSFSIRIDFDKNYLAPVFVDERFYYTLSPLADSSLVFTKHSYNSLVVGVTMTEAFSAGAEEMVLLVFKFKAKSPGDTAIHIVQTDTTFFSENLNTPFSGYSVINSSIHIR
ncbi:MAG TPA: cohesin domain-containing protein [Petrotogaceae bacterium]|nr:cohesin domain-containing protein [Petrotogaceae bacterium]